MKRDETLLRVCLDARFPDGAHNGVRATIAGLASALAELDGDERYFFLGFQDSHEWLRPFLRNGNRILAVERTKPPEWKAVAKRIPGLSFAWQYLAPWVKDARVVHSDGTIERQQIDVMHFTSQKGFLTSIPTIFEPHDLQHLHFPQFFTPKERYEREVVYPTLCEQAKAVVVMSTWGKDDLTRRYGLLEDKVAVIPWAPATTICADPTADEMSAVRQKYALPTRFAFFPAQTWPHKNHLGLLDGVAMAKARYGTEISVVCTGHQTKFFKTIQERIRGLRLGEQVRFLGFVSAADMRCLYRLSHCLVFPTRFEGWGMPLLEAFHAEVPAACSNISPLKEQADGAALLFDPCSPERIAHSLLRLWTDEPLRQQLIAKGRERLQLFSWDHTARLFRALYRKLASRRLSEEDRTLLAAPPLA